MRLPPLHRPTFTLYFYKNWQSWAVVFSVTMANASFQFGPLWLGIFWRTF